MKSKLHQTGQPFSECCWLVWTAVQIGHVHLHIPIYRHKSLRCLKVRATHITWLWSYITSCTCGLLSSRQSDQLGIWRKTAATAFEVICGWSPSFTMSQLPRAAVSVSGHLLVGDFPQRDQLTWTHLQARDLATTRRHCGDPGMGGDVDRNDTCTHCPLMGLF